MLNSIYTKILRLMDIVNDKDAQNIERQLQRKALNDTAEFVEKNMIKTRSFPDNFTLLDYSLNLAKKDGLFLEFGVFTGKTINFISSKIDCTVYGFDSFEGLPEDWREGFEKGRFKVKRLPKVRENVRLIKGWFADTLPQFINDHSEDCSFIHVDCDLYSSTKTIFQFLNNKIKKDTIIVFDEFFNYPGWREGEYKAFIEFIQNDDLKYEYIGYCHYHEQVAVKIH